ncbi:MAG: class I SAM-dependent methyltransferase [Deltaproteobacteria bacterium]|nr:class I SAM-dependent methyltransferase [Deltaproteobacteria bacterium]
MRQSIKDFVRLAARTLPLPEPIYEFGSLQVEGQEGFADLRVFFTGKEYVGADMRPGPGVDVVLNLHHLELADETVGAALIMDTLEHVEYPRRALQEAYRVLKPQGVLLLSSVMNYPIHDHPYDYWRFTPEGFRSLLQAFPCVLVDFAGDPAFPRTVLGLGCKGTLPEEALRRFQEGLADWKLQHSVEEHKPFLKQAKEMVVPPGLRLLWRKLRRTLGR